MTQEQHAILDDGPRAGLQMPEWDKDGDGDQEAADLRESLAGSYGSERARREALAAQGGLHPLFGGVFQSHFPGMKYADNGARR